MVAGGPQVEEPPLWRIMETFPSRFWREFQGIEPERRAYRESHACSAFVSSPQHSVQPMALLYFRTRKTRSAPSKSQHFPWRKVWNTVACFGKVWGKAGSILKRHIWYCKLSQWMMLIPTPSKLWGEITISLSASRSSKLLSSALLLSRHQGTAELMFPKSHEGL